MAFVKATKSKQRARVCLIGPSGSGKTYTALTLAKHLGTRIAVIDTERGSAAKYAGDVADFDHSELDGQYPPRAYVTQIREAAAAGYDVLVIDSLSHAWEGTGGILSQVDEKGGRFDSWKDMDPQLRGLIDAILTYPGHVIVTLRTKTEWVVEKVERKGKTVSEPRKVGVAPRFKDGLEYEFDVVALMDDRNMLTVTKSRCAALNAYEVIKPGKPFADALLTWLDDGVSPEDTAARLLAACESASSAADVDAIGHDPELRRLTPTLRAQVVAAGKAARARIETADRQDAEARERAEAGGAS
jgi:energy-coupling factor transporter ATP-binding protein EcfA2